MDKDVVLFNRQPSLQNVHDGSHRAGDALEDLPV